MNGPAFTPFMAQNIIEADDADSRFERFCCDVYSQHDGMDYFSTAASWDMGRDGRATGRLGNSENGIVLVSLRKDYETKLKSDLERLSATTTPTSVRFACNFRLTEHSRDKATAIIQECFPNVEFVLAEGSIQLASLALKYPRCLESFYGGELGNLRTALEAKPEGSDQYALRGLRTALVATVGEDAQELRLDISRQLVLEILGEKQRLPLRSIAKQLSDGLSLPRVVEQHYVRAAIQHLVDEDLIEAGDEFVTLTETGKDTLAKSFDRKVGTLLDARKHVGEELHAATGKQLSPDDFSSFWGVFQIEVAALFLEHGIEVVESISADGKEGEVRLEKKGLLALLDRLVDKVNALGLNKKYGIDIGQAVRDVFSFPNSQSHRMLCDICMIFVGICSLGLDPAAQEAMTKRLAEIDLLIDTDVVLSYLSIAEPDHEAVVDTLQAWTKYYGKILLTDPVLEEAAYHAWISQSDYDSVEGELDHYDKYDVRRYIENVFVRAFWKIREPGAPVRQWYRFITAYRGATPYDSNKIRNVFLATKGFEYFPENKTENKLADRVKQCLIDAKLDNYDTHGPAYVSVNFESKCERDGRLVALMKERQKTLRESGGGVCAIVSSSSLLRAALKAIPSLNEYIDPVLSLASIGFLLAFQPGVKLGLKSLKTLLFDEGMRQRMKPLQRKVMRIMRSSEQYDIFWSNRPVLCTEIDKEVLSLAKQRGEKRVDTEKMLLADTEESRENLIEVIAKAVDRISPSLDELRAKEMEHQIEKLKRENDLLRRKKR